MVLVERSIVQKDLRAKNRTDSTMDIYCLQHVPYEGPGKIRDWAIAHGHDFRVVRLYHDEPLPDVRELDLLVLMGGPMSVQDEAQYSWLLPEKKLIGRCLAEGKLTFGVCLGAQLLAEVLGARVYRNQWKEIGWFAVERCSPDGGALFRSLPRQFPVFQWHAETFELPPGTTQLATSEACSIQAFEHPYALGLQFHLEVTEDGVADLVRECGSEIDSGPYEQTPRQILTAADHFASCTSRLYEVLDAVDQRIAYSGSLVI